MQYYYEEYTVKQQILERRSTSALVPAGKPSKVQSGASLDVLASIGAMARRSSSPSIQGEFRRPARQLPHHHRHR